MSKKFTGSNECGGRVGPAGIAIRLPRLRIAVAVAAALLIAPVSAQLGERREAVEALFGAPKAADEAAGRVQYAWGGGSVVVEYENGGVRAMRWIGAEPMWPDEYKEALEKNGGLAAWKPATSAEARSAGKAFKVWTRADGSTASIPEADLNSLVLRFAGTIKPPPTPKPTPTPAEPGADGAALASAPAKPAKNPAGFAVNPLWAAALIGLLLVGLMASRIARKKKLAALRARRLARRDADPASLSMDECSWDEFELLIAEMMRQAGMAITICPAGGAEGEAFLASGENGRVAVSCDHRPGGVPVGEAAVRLALGFKKASGADAVALAVSRDLSPAAAKLAETEGVRVIPRAEIQAWLDGVVREKKKNPVDFSWWIAAFRRKVQLKGVLCPKCGTGMALNKELSWVCTKPRCGGKRPAVRLLVETE